MALESTMKKMEHAEMGETLFGRTAQKRAVAVAVPQEVGMGEMERAAGGGPNPIDGVINFCSWVACGFNHHYKYTGKTQNRIDLFWHVTFYQRICQDCGHVDWTRSEP